jgi:hypothetical protein
MLIGHRRRAGGFPCRSLRKLSQCDPPASSVEMIPMTSNVVPTLTADRQAQNRLALGGGETLKAKQVREKIERDLR